MNIKNINIKEDAGMGSIIDSIKENDMAGLALKTGIMRDVLMNSEWKWLATLNPLMVARTGIDSNAVIRLGSSDPMMAGLGLIDLRICRDMLLGMKRNDALKCRDILSNALTMERDAGVIEGVEGVRGKAMAMFKELIDISEVEYAKHVQRLAIEKLGMTGYYGAGDGSDYDEVTDDECVPEF